MATQDEMRAKFHALGRQRIEILAKSTQVRAEYDQLRDQECKLREQMRPVSDKLRELEAPLFDIDNERGMISRALNGKTGEPG